MGIDLILNLEIQLERSRCKMYVLVSKVGCNYGILDTDDGALDWVTLEIMNIVQLCLCMLLIKMV